MSYLALARKWRPRTFAELVGQEHVVKALSNALSMERIHHAWLFTGTRGVGKTTLARILAKSLNCEKGISAEPCNVCTTCMEIDQGRFVDYIEVDAASNRGVEDIAQLLSQAVYAPTSGRFKIFTIDEVHMLSGHAFNAMLKTLEEPPPHVKFILATTDPQKIPVTVLSRCIQYNLKRMAPELVVSHLQEVLQHEEVTFDIHGLRLIAQGANGSMRDALSLADQAIAFSAGNITGQAMQEMLGTIDQPFLSDLLKALQQGQAKKVVDLANTLSARSYSFEGALADLAVLLSRIAMEQRLPGITPVEDLIHDDIQQLATCLHPDTVQLFYSIAVNGRIELSHAPDEYAGFVMVCLRMLALVSTPAVVQELNSNATAVAAQDFSTTLQSQSAPVAVVTPNLESSLTASITVKADATSDTGYNTAPVGSTVSDESVVKQANTLQDFTPAWEDIPTAVSTTQAEKKTLEKLPISGKSDDSSVVPLSALSLNPSSQDPALVTAFHAQSVTSKAQEIDDMLLDRFSSIDEPANVEPVSADDEDNFELMQAPGPDDAMVWTPQEVEAGEHAITLNNLNENSWLQLVRSLSLSGLVGEIACHSQWLKTENNTIYLKINIQNTQDLNVKNTLTTILTEYFGQVVKLVFEWGQTGNATVHAQNEQELQKRRLVAKQIVAQDPFVKGLIDQFGAKVDEQSIRLLD